MKTLNAAAAAAKWAGVTPGRTQEYTDGVNNPKRPWLEATIAGADAYKAGITESITRGAFAKGVQAAGQAKYVAQTIAKGPQRFAEGVQLAQDNYATKIAPFLTIINNTQLPPRFAKGDVRNIKRVEVLAMALRKGRTG